MKRILLAVFVAAALLSPAAPAAAAGWCGSGSVAADRLPDVAAGAEVHALYVVPADAPDNFDADAGGIADDVAAIDAWWRSQDFTRAPRFDTYPFPSCGGVPGLDISDVRLPQSASSLYAQNGRFGALEFALTRFASPFSSPYKKYIVYYDGPVENDDLCGTGGGSATTGPSFAVVWMQACVGSGDRAAVAAHELIHTLGAVPRGAPHRCVDSGHVCDTSSDLMYPYVEGNRPLGEFALDVGHDDYYAHGGPWFDVQDSAWLRHLDVPAQPLAVAFAGGSGAVLSDLPGIACTAGCTATFDGGTVVTLSADAPTGRRFVRWRGACSGDSTCELILDAPRSVTAVFGPARVRLRVTVVGRGSVVGSVSCARSCTRTVDAASALQLRAKPARGWRFAGWRGACHGTRACASSSDADLAVRATFRRV